MYRLIFGVKNWGRGLEEVGSQFLTNYDQKTLLF